MRAINRTVSFTNLTNQVITEISNSDFKYYDLQPNQSIQLDPDTYAFYLNNDNIQGWTDDLHNISPVAQYSDFVIYDLSGETTSAAIYKPHIYNGDYYINTYNLPYQSELFNFTHNLVYPSSPITNKNFSGIYTFKSNAIDRTVQAVILALRSGDNYLPIADNFNYKFGVSYFTASVLQSLVDDTTSNKVSPQTMFYNGCDNVIKLNNLKLLMNDPFNGDDDYTNVRYLTDKSTSFFGYSETSTSDVSTTLTGTFNIIATAIGAALPIFTYVIFPGITLGMLILIPLMFALLLSILRLIKKGS